MHYVMVSKIQWKPFWLATQLYPQNDWTGWHAQNRVNYDVYAQAQFEHFQRGRKKKHLFLYKKELINVSFTLSAEERRY